MCAGRCQERFHPRHTVQQVVWSSALNHAASHDWWFVGLHLRHAMGNVIERKRAVRSTVHTGIDKQTASDATQLAVYECQLSSHDFALARNAASSILRHRLPNQYLNFTSPLNVTSLHLSRLSESMPWARDSDVASTYSIAHGW